MILLAVVPGRALGGKLAQDEEHKRAGHDLAHRAVVSEKHIRESNFCLLRNKRGFTVTSAIRWLRLSLKKKRFFVQKKRKKTRALSSARHGRLDPSFDQQQRRTALRPHSCVSREQSPASPSNTRRCARGGS